MNAQTAPSARQIRTLETVFIIERLKLLLLNR